MHADLEQRHLLPEGVDCNWGNLAPGGCGGEVEPLAVSSRVGVDGHEEVVLVADLRISQALPAPPATGCQTRTCSRSGSRLQAHRDYSVCSCVPVIPRLCREAVVGRGEGPEGSGNRFRGRWGCLARVFRR